MNYEELIHKIVNDKAIREIAYKIAGNSDISEDLYQEIILTILEMDKEQILKLEKKKQLNFYIVRIATSHFRNPYNSFAKKYQHLQVFKDRDKEIIKEMQILNNTTPTDIAKLSKLKQLTWYEREMCKIYSEFGSARKVEQQTGISYRSVAHTIKQAKQKLN